MKKCFLAIVTAMALFGTGSAQQQTVERIIAEPVHISTYQFFPQISESTIRVPLSHENPGGVLGDLPLLDSPIKLGGTTKGSPSRSTKYPGVNWTGWYPPDTHMAVGPSHIVQTVNSSVGFFDKSTGSQVFLQGLSTFFAPAGPTTNFLYDPKVLYDRLAGRFFLVVLEEDDATSNSHLLVAVSDDTNPVGTWYMYRVDTSGTLNAKSCWADYPSIGYNNDYFVFGNNMFTFSNSSYQGQEFVTMSKSQMLTGGTPVINKILLSSGSIPGFTAQVCESYDASMTDKVYAISTAGGTTSTTLALWTIKNISTTPVVTTSNFTVPSYTWPSVYAKTGSNQSIDSLGSRLMHAYFRNNKVYTSHSINSANPIQVRWYEVNVNTTTNAGTLNQSGNIVDGTSNTIMPAIAPNGFGNIGAVYTKAGPSGGVMADLMFASRKSSDTAGTMTNVTTLQSSTATSYNLVRWGDYSACCVDPVNDDDYWVANMVAEPNNRWRTYFFKVVVSQPVLNSVALAVDTIAGGGSTTGTVTMAAPVNSNTAVNLSSNSGLVTVPPTVTVLAAGSTADFNVSTSVTAVDTLVTVTASYNGVDKTDTLLVQAPATLQSLTISPDPIYSGGKPTGTVHLSAPAGAGGILVALSEQASDISVPVTVTVLNGNSTADFLVTTLVIQSQTTRTIKATYNGVTVSDTITLLPFNITTIVFSPSNLRGGQTATCTVTFSNPAPPNLQLRIADNDARTGVPNTVNVPEGATSVDFPITSVGTPTQFQVQITYRIGANYTKVKFLNVYPPLNYTLTLNPTSVKGGTNSTATSTILGKAYAGLTMNTSSSNTATATVPATITYSTNQSSKNFTVTTFAVASTRNVIIRTTFGGVTKAATLTVTP